MNGKNYALIVAGGKGSRMQSDIPKQFIELQGKPILMHTMERFYGYDKHIGFVLVLPPSQIENWTTLCKKFAFNLNHKITKGGENRFYSSKNGLSAIKGIHGVVAIHDGVRPLVSFDTLARCFETARKKGNAIPCSEIVESVRVTEKNGNFPVDRTKYVSIQTPQVFQLNLIKKAYEQPFSDEFTDDSTVLEKAGHKINLVQGNRENIKITNSLDLIIAKALMEDMLVRQIGPNAS